MGLLEFSGGMIIRLDPLCSVDGKFVSAVVNLEKIVDLLTWSSPFKLISIHMIENTRILW